MCVCACVGKKKEEDEMRGGDLKIILKILQKRCSTISSDLTQILTAPLEVGKFLSIHESTLPSSNFSVCVFRDARTQEC